MIYAKFNQKKGLINQFILTGHAGSGPYGYDLVCAAVSALAIGATNNLYQLISVEPVVETKADEGGFLRVSLPDNLDEQQKDYSELLLQSLYYSLLDIEEEYGEFISVDNINTYNFK